MINDNTLIFFRDHLVKIAQEKEKSTKSPVWSSEQIKAMVGKVKERYIKARMRAGEFRDWSRRLASVETGGKHVVNPESGAAGKWQMFPAYAEQYGGYKNISKKQLAALPESEHRRILRGFWTKSVKGFKPEAGYTRQFSKLGIPPEKHPGAYRAMVHFMGKGGFRQHIRTHGSKWTKHTPSGPHSNITAGEYLGRMYPEYTKRATTVAAAGGI